MPARSPFSCVLWDVDGTIIDASDGILRRLTITLERYGRPAPTRDELVHWIGPPLYESFQKQGGMDPDEATRAVTSYRALGKAEGYTTDVRLIPGIKDVLDDLAAIGVPQATASSKPEIQVAAIMEHFDLTRDLLVITGATDDEKTLADKADIVAESLRRLAAAGADISRPVLIGDRHHDVDGGAANDVPVVFVRWGFSWPHESDGAQAAVDDVAALHALLILDDAP